MKAIMAWTGGRAPPSQHTRSPCAGSHWLGGLAQLAHFALQRSDALVLGRGRAGAPALVALGLANPVAQRLRRAADLGGNRADRGRLRGVLALVVEHHPDRTGTDLRRIRGYALGHGSILPGSGASGKPGAVHCLLTCEVCGLAMYGVTRPATATKPERQYYECRGKDCVLSARTAACPSRHVKAEEIEPVVWNYVASLLADPDRLLAQFDHLAATAEAGSARDQAAEQQLRARLDRTVRADKRLLDAYQAGAITLAELSERRQVLASERQVWERQQEEQPRLRQQRLRAEAVRRDLAAFCS